MAAPPLLRSLSTRSVKKLEKPRPLKVSIGQSKVAFPSEPSPRVPLQDLMTLVESVSHSLLDKSLDENLASNVAIMHSKLKVHGQQLEAIFKDQLDRAFVIFRNGCQDDGLFCTTRLNLLELVELRANQWSNSNNTEVYYSAKMASTDIEPIVTTDTNMSNSVPVPSPSSPNPPALGPGEVLKTSGKFPKPTKIPGKNYCKDEVVIRNSDSGKVEFMRPLILKSPVNWNSARYLYPPQFFRPTYPALWTPQPAYLVNPGAKERLVQITGPSEDKIIHARHLMEDTIRRNASPVREGNERERMGGSTSSLNSSASDESNRFIQPGTRKPALLHSYSTNDATLGEYKYTVNLGFDSVKITGTNFETVRNAKLVLEEYYTLWLQKNCIGDCFEIEEDVFLDPAQEMAMLRLNSVDSGLDQGFPVFPIPPQPEKRAVLGRSDSFTSPLSPQSQDNNIVAVTRKYSREFMIECAVSPFSKMAPPDWDQVLAECPVIAKKVPQQFYSYENYIPPYTYSDAWTYVDPYAFPN